MEMKGLGLPDRYRLFFRPFEAEGRKLLLILWLGFPRKDGDRKDCYAVFKQMVRATLSLRRRPEEGWLEWQNRALRRTQALFCSKNGGDYSKGAGDTLHMWQGRADARRWAPW